MLLLDAFCCAGLGADGYQSAGFEVIGLDNDPRALKHNPHQTICDDAMTLLADKGFMSQFDAVHASPPCQAHSATRKLADAQGRGAGRGVDLLDPVRDLLLEWGGPWIIENVERSPVKKWDGAVRLCGSSWGLLVQRHRMFAPSPGLELVGSKCDHRFFEKDPITGKPRPWGVYYAKGDSIPSGGRTVHTLEQGHQVMGIHHRSVPWKYLCEGLPPLYTRHLGRQLKEHLK